MGCRVIAPSVVLDSLDIPEESKIGIADHESAKIGDFRITAIPVPHMEYCESSPSHSISYGYIIVLEGKTLFHAGDTIAHERLASDLKRFLPVDYILLPINGHDEERTRAGIIGNMDGEEAIAFASGLGARHLVPTHFDLFRENGADADAFSHLAKGRIDVVIPVPGGIIRL